MNYESDSTCNTARAIIIYQTTASIYRRLQGCSCCCWQRESSIQRNHRAHAT